MAKAKREITESLRVVDVVLEVLDARLPLASANPMLREVTAAKARVAVLTRKDLADPACTAAWLAHFQALGQEVVVIDARSGDGVRQVVPALERVATAKRARERARGLKPGVIRAMVAGIPNVGKSSVINRLAGRAATKIGDRPGITKTQQWIRLGQVQLLDTPGVLWPKLDDEHVAYTLAITGAIKSEILDVEALAAYLLSWLSQRYPDALRERYGISLSACDWGGLEAVWPWAEEGLRQIGMRRGLVRPGGVPDVERAAQLLIRELQTGRLGRISFEWPPDEAAGPQERLGGPAADDVAPESAPAKAHGES
ncbi:MAG: ribosome biogenesis GTPase YlqF [Alicyclobacillus sp.]|nr:ribosome biogenesis GTPase YlqF [Alicyclobacillus sp.]